MASASVSKSGGMGVVIWKISVAGYLIANGVLGLLTPKRGDFMVLFLRLFRTDEKMLNILVTVTAIMALIAGIAVLLELFNVKISYMDTLLFIISIVWIVFVIIELISLFATDSKPDFWGALQGLSVRFLILGSLMIASKRFK